MLLKKTGLSMKMENNNAYRVTKMLDLFKEFEQSEENVLEIVNWEDEYKNTCTITSTINKAAHRFGMTQYKAFQCRGHVFLKKVNKREVTEEATQHE